MEEQEHQVPSLFTFALVQLIVAALLFFSLLNNQRELALLSLLVLGVIGGARLWANASLSRVECHLTLDKLRVFPAEPISLRVTVENGKLLPIWLQAEIPLGNLVRRSAGQTILAKATSLLWYERTVFDWELVADRRGICQIGPLEIWAGDLFSFYFRRRRIERPQFLIVYPRLVPLQPVTFPRRDFFGVPRPNSPVQDPVYILGTRDYQHGQPSKYIHWKASARHHRLQEKVFESSVQEKVLLALDVDSFARRAAAKEFESALEVIASLAVRLDRQGHSVGLVANGALQGNRIASIPVKRTRGQLPTILETLARLRLEPQGELRELVRRRLAEAWGVSCAYFAYAEDDSVHAASRFFASIRVPVVFFVDRRGFPRLSGPSPAYSRVHILDDIRAAGDKNP